MIALFKIGWAKAVPVNMYNFKNPKVGMGITALAGPLSNIVLAAVALLILGFVYAPLYEMGTAGAVLEQMLRYTAQISVALAVFNIIPIPPLDGSKILFMFLPDTAYFQLMRYERFGMIFLVLLVMSGALSGVLSSVIGFVFSKMFVLAELSNQLYLSFFG